jgi:Helix-destabilising protein.
MFRVIVETADVFEKKGIAAKTGKPYQIREQEVYVYLLDSQGVEKKFPSAIRVGLDDSPAYQPGEYRLSPDFLHVGDFARLMVGRIRLLPKAAALAAARTG